MSTLGDLMIRVGAEISGFSDAMKSVVSQASDAADKVADKLEQVGDVGQRMAVLGGIMTAAITVPLEEIARRSLDVAGNFEQTRIAFHSLMGSSAAAKDKLSELIQFAQNTPFEIPQVLDGARKLVALGFAAKDIVPILRIVGDQAAAMGQGGVGMDRILMNLGKIEAQGKITGHELRNLGEDDVPALASIARALGKSKEETSKLVSAGKIDAETAINAILQGMQLRTGGLMASQMDSFKAQLSNLKDQITTTFDAIGQTLLPVGKLLIKWAQDAMDGVKELAQWFAQLPAPIQASAIALAAFAASAGPALVAIGGLGMALPNVMAGFAALAKFGTLIGGAITGTVEYISTLAAMVSEYGVAATAGVAFGDGLTGLAGILLGWPALIIAAIAALAGLATWVYTHWEGVKAFLRQVFDGLGEAWNATLGVALNWVSTAMGGAAKEMVDVWNWFKGIFTGIWDAVGSVLHKAVDGFKSDLQDLVKLLEKIPGMQKVFSAGAAFSKADHDASERGEMAEVGKALRVGADNKPFAQTDKYQADLEKHNAKLKEAVELLAKFKKGYEDGIVSEKDFKQAQANVDFIRQDVPKRELKADAASKTKLDRNALDGLSGAHAHEEALVALQRAQIEHDYQMSKPGSAAKLGESAEDQAKADIAAAEKRKAALDATYEDERKKTLKNLDDKMALYKNDQAGHEKLIQAKLAAEDRYSAAIQKTTFDLETIKKQADDRIQAAHNKQIEDDLKAQQKSYEMAVKTVDLKVQALDKETQFQIKQSQFNAGLRDKDLQFELEAGNLSKAQYLRLKQEQYDAAYAMEVAALEQERDLIESEFADLLDKAKTPEQRQQVMADRRKRIATLDDRQQSVENRHTGQQQDTDLGLKKIELGKLNTVFGPVQSGFASAISNMIKGTQTLKQAWNSMATGILGKWIDTMAQNVAKWATHLAQMAAMWVMHKLGIVTVHAAANQAQVASDAAASAQSRSISLGQHFHEVMLAAKTAGAKAYQSVVGIPVIGPVLAPVAAVAAFAGVMAFSAEGGAVLPNHDSMLFAHPQEMVLPKHISVGLQNLISSGGLSNAGSIMNQSQGGSMSSTALQMMRNTAATDTGDTHHEYNGPLHYHAANGESLTVDTFGKMYKRYVRENNLKMA